MRLLTGVAAIACAVFAEAAWAGPQEEEVYAAFETYCLTHINQPSVIPKLFENIGIKPLPPKKAEPFLMPQKGTVLRMSRWADGRGTG